MPRQKQGASFELKHRLAGAAVLIGVAVIVLPMLLGGPREARNTPDEAAASDQSDTKVFRSNITPIGGATPSVEPRDEKPEQTVAELLGEEDASSGNDTRAADAAEAQPSDDTGETGQAAEGGETDSPVASRSEESGAPEPAAMDEAPQPKQIDRGWIVQVGTFMKPGNVERLVAMLEQSGFEASTTEVETSGGNATRVWVGPFETRVEAARIKNRVTRQVGPEGLIVAYP